MNCVVGADEEVDAGLGQFVGGVEHEFGDAVPIAAIEKLHISGERVGVHCDFRVRMRAQQLRALFADGAIAVCGALSGTTDNPDVLRHELIL
jgi:hypothetical protein